MKTGCGHRFSYFLTSWEGGTPSSALLAEPAQDVGLHKQNLQLPPELGDKKDSSPDETVS